jgi:uncharacterized protein YbjT (DUF2867 family)
MAGTLMAQEVKVTSLMSKVMTEKGAHMKIVVIGGTGLIGSKTVAILRESGHEVVAASPNTGVNTITGEGLKEAMAGTQVVIDLANSPSFEDKAVLEFFQTSGRNLLAAEAAAGVRHHVALSIVGTDRTPDNGYFRAKVAQEKLIETSGIPYTIIRSTQFIDFIGRIADSGTDGSTVRISPGLFQPIASDDVAASVADVALAAPRNGIVEIAGPDPSAARISAGPSISPALGECLFQSNRYDLDWIGTVDSGLTLEIHCGS